MTPVSQPVAVQPSEHVPVDALQILSGGSQSGSLVHGAGSHRPVASLQKSPFRHDGCCPEAQPAVHWPDSQMVSGGLQFESSLHRGSHRPVLWLQP